jgi:hypothetical protein
MSHHLGDCAEYSDTIKPGPKKFEDRLVVAYHTTVDLFNIKTLTRLDTAPPILTYTAALLEPRPDIRRRYNTRI